MIKNNKRGQVTIFIIIGILIVVVAGIVFFASENKFSKRSLSDNQVEPVRTYLRECVMEIVKEELNDRRMQSGKVDPGDLDCGVGYRNVRILGNGVGAERFLDQKIRNSIQRQLSEEKRCSLSVFEDQFNFAKENDIDISVKFKRKKIEVLVRYGTVVSKGINSIGVGDILVDINEDINEINEIVRYFVNNYNGWNLDNIKNEINEGSVELGNTRIMDVDGEVIADELNADQIRGANCDDDRNGIVDRELCDVQCWGVPNWKNCCFINTRFDIENEIGGFMFGLG